MPFLTRLKVDRVAPRKYKLELPLTYSHPLRVFTAPPGFITDYASIPKALRWLYDPDGEYTPAAVIHDYLYKYGCRLDITRSEADRVFKDAMRELDIPWLRRFNLWSAVRIGGWLPWRKYRQEQCA